MALAARLGGALAIRTVSRPDPRDMDHAAFAAFRRYLEDQFPRVHDRLEREAIGDHHALLFRWPGSDAAQEPWLFVSHQDVVPAEDGGNAGWTHPPFSGAVADGFVWGRGAIDLKLSLMAMLEACEALLAEGFRPRRTVYLAFGADEEVGGGRGAALIADALAASGVRLAFTLDEGGVVMSDTIPGVRRPVAFIGTAEKGDLSVRLTARAEGGHSSLPPRHTAPGRLARLLAKIDRQPFPARLDSPTWEMFERAAPHAAWPYRPLYSHLRLTAPLLLRLFVRQPAGNAAARTTATVTELVAGGAGNVIPAEASARVNLRLKPGDRAEAAIARLRRLADREGVALEVIDLHEASSVSSPDGPAFRALAGSIAAVLPDTVTVPCQVPNASDCRHYARLARNQYRFVPVRLQPGDLARIHGVDERIAIDNYAETVRFFADFVRRADGAAS